MSNNIQDTVELIKKSRTAPSDELMKGFTQSGSATSGLTAYDLEAPAKQLYPVLTPLRNMIPRVSGKGGIQANWRAITGINTNNLSAGVSGGNRGGSTAHTTADYLAAYKGYGLEDYVDFEAEYAAEYFDDVKARAVEGLLRSFMIQEENLILGGNTSTALGTTPTPSLSASASGGTLGTLTLSVICVALGYDGYWNVAGYNNGATNQSLAIASAVVQPSITRVNADGTSDTYGGGVARKSAAASTAITGNTGSCAATVTAVQGAVAYAWYWGLAGAEVLGAITTINSVSITANATGSQTAASLPTADNSTNALVFDGLLTQINKSGSGAYVKTLATGTAGTGTVLSSDSAGGISQLTDAFQSFWNLYRLSPEKIFVNSQELINMNSKIIAAGGTPLYRFQIDGNNPGVINAGVALGSILNKITNTMVKVEVHPTMPPGTIMFYSERIPYSLSNVGNVVQMRMRRDYYQIEWPRTRRKYEYGVYADGVLQNYFPPAFGVITNIANG
jgi:hypothetical protein